MQVANLKYLRDAELCYSCSDIGLEEQPPLCPSHATMVSLGELGNPSQFPFCPEGFIHLSHLLGKYSSCNNKATDHTRITWEEMTSESPSWKATFMSMLSSLSVVHHLPPPVPHPFLSGHLAPTKARERAVLHTFLCPTIAWLGELTLISHFSGMPSSLGGA